MCQLAALVKPHQAKPRFEGRQSDTRADAQPEHRDQVTAVDVEGVPTQEDPHGGQVARAKADVPAPAVNQQSEINHQQSAISSQLSAVSHQRSAINNQQSAIRNPHGSRPFSLASLARSLPRGTMPHFTIRGTAVTQTSLRVAIVSPKGTFPSKPRSSQRECSER